VVGGLDDAKKTRHVPSNSFLRVPASWSLASSMIVVFQWFVLGRGRLGQRTRWKTRKEMGGDASG